ncbi:hypothetical protein NL676_014533 [Syzygium grande]|nr:hypothetical protein NL676_014533 [Syzygium grande]
MLGSLPSLISRLRELPGEKMPPKLAIVLWILSWTFYDAQNFSPVEKYKGLIVPPRPTLLLRRCARSLTSYNNKDNADEKSKRLGNYARHDVFDKGIGGKKCMHYPVLDVPLKLSYKSIAEIEGLSLISCFNVQSYVRICPDGHKGRWPGTWDGSMVHLISCEMSGAQMSKFLSHSILHLRLHPNPTAHTPGRKPGGTKMLTAAIPPFTRVMQDRKRSPDNWCPP